MSYDGDQSEDRQSEEVQSAYKSHGGGVLRGYFNLDRSEEQNEENEWSWIPQDGDPLAESMSSLQTTQEALENGKFLFSRAFHMHSVFHVVL